jgi:hypothetical protein
LKANSTCRQPDDFAQRRLRFEFHEAFQFFREHFHIENFSAQAEESGTGLALLRRTISHLTTLVGAAD